MTRRTGRILAVALLSSLLAACAQTTRVVLLPQADGSPSAVVVRTKEGEQVLSQPYQRATAIAGRDAPTLDTTSASEVETQHQTLFQLRPPKPQRFTLYFDAGGIVLTPASRETMAQVLAAVREHPGADITVTGHTDTTGTGARNDALSRQRAQEVRQMIAQQGFSIDRIEAIGRGQRDLAVPTADGTPEPYNRRVVIEVR